MTAAYRAEVLEYIDRILETGELGDSRGSGRFNRELESRFIARLGVGHALTMNSATAALHAALVAVGVERDDEVIVDPLLKYGAVAAMHAGAIPVFADIDPATFLIDPASVADTISDRTRAVICTATFGMLPDTPSIVRLARERGIAVVEDCAQAIMARRGGRISGTGCDAGIFSFQMTKHLSTGEGGLLVSDRPEVIDRARSIREHGWSPGCDVVQERLGWMYRMPEACAAFGIAGFGLLDTTLALHKNAGAMLCRAVENRSWISSQHVPPGDDHVYWTWGARVDSASRFELLAERIAELGGDFEIGYCAGGPIYRRPFIQHHFKNMPRVLWRYAPGICPHAEELIGRMIHMRIDARRGVEYYQQQSDLLAIAIDEVEAAVEV
jgi:perosamine synthetase